MARSATAPKHFLVLVYRMPSSPTASRVAVWRQLKKIGGIYLQQTVTAFPQVPRVTQELQKLLRKIEDSGGEFHLLPLRKLSEVEETKLVRLFAEQSTRHYQEIIENCEVNFAKEIEFETFRRNFTYEEAEEIRAEFDKIVDWYERVSDRDWFGAPNRDEALEWLRRSRERLEEFEGAVYAAQTADSSTLSSAAPDLSVIYSMRSPTRHAKGRRISPKPASGLGAEQPVTGTAPAQHEEPVTRPADD